MAIVGEYCVVSLKCDDPSHAHDDPSRSIAVSGTDSQAALRNAVLHGWSVDTNTGEARCPAHRMAAEESPLRKIASERATLMRNGESALAFPVQKLASAAAFEALRLMPTNVDLQVLNEPGPGGGALVLTPPREARSLGRLFVLSASRSTDRIEPPGVGTTPYSTTCILLSREGGEGNTYVQRSWEGSLRKPLLEALSMIEPSMARRVQDLSFEWHVEDPDLYAAVFAGSAELEPWWSAEAAVASMPVKMLLARVAEAFAPALVELVTNRSRRRLRAS